MSLSYIYNISLPITLSSSQQDPSKHFDSSFTNTSNRMKKWQLVFVPIPSISHLMPMVELAKLLVNRHENLSITVLIIKAPYDPAGDAYTDSLTSSHSFPKRLSFIHLPRDHDPNYDQALNNPASFVNSLVESHKVNVRKAVSALISGPESPGLAGFVVDMYCSTMIDVANEFGVPTEGFFTASAAFLGYMLHIHTLRERDNVDTTALNFKDSGAEFAIPSYKKLVPTSVFPDVALDKEWATFFPLHASRLKKMKGIVVNTFEELEPHAIQSFFNADFSVYPVGPILSVGEKYTVQRGSEVIEWLDGQPPRSVVFLCFGSRGYFDDDDQVKEIARALEISGTRFVWTLPLRKRVGKSSLEGPRDCCRHEDILPEGFLKRTGEIGRVIGWAPQAKILSHEAVGGFVSHCGWNSILESTYHEVPIATWPLYSEQQLNAFQLVHELNLGVEISLDYRTDQLGSVRKSGVVSAERIEKGIRQVMEKESEVRKKVKHVSELCKRALMEGGSSYAYLERFVHDMLI